MIKSFVAIDAKKSPAHQTDGWWRKGDKTVNRSKS
jgi:hypothetical protein